MSKKNVDKNQQYVDVLITGGGLVGASLACALSSTGKKVAIIEAHPLDAETQPSYDDRTVALTYGGRQILKNLGLWKEIDDAAEPIKTIHISDRGHFGVTRLRHTEENVEALGYVVENRALGRMLYDRIEESENISLYCPATVVGLDQDEHQASVDIKMEEQSITLTTKLAVAADGVGSPVRELLNIGISQQSYNQCAIITNVTPGQDHENVAYERFTESGPLAFLPMTGNRCSVVWTLKTGDVDDIMSLTDEEFLRRLQGRFGYRLGSLRKVGKRQVYPLSLIESTQLVRGRIVVVGNAAHTLHPVAGQGFNLGLRDITLLAELIARSEDAGSEELLDTYMQERSSDAHRVFRFTDTLVKVFSNNSTPLGHLRSTGLLLVDLFPAVKHRLATQSMGLSDGMASLGSTLKHVG